MTFLFGPLGRWLAVAAVVLAGLAAVYRLGGQDARREAGDLRDTLQTRERIDDAVQDMDRRSDDDIDAWLRGRAGQPARPLRWD